jgi:N-acetylneuraminate epimerase
MKAQTPQSLTFERIAGFPSQEKGIEKGVSACFAGTADGMLIMAGGCNFPDVPAADGGKKKYYRGIYAAEITDRLQLEWQQVGQLPTACAYGVSVQTADGMLCIGGNNADESLTQVLKITLCNQTAVIEELPPLPVAMDNFTGCGNDKEVTVYNGEHVFCMDLLHPENGWSEKTADTHEKLGQPVSGYINGIFHVWGGSTAKTDTKDATLRIDGTMFGKTQSAVPAPADDANRKLFLGGGAAVNITDSTLIAIGGVNRDVFLDAVNNPKPDYMKHPAEWYRFNPYITLYDGHCWHLLGKSRITARAGAALVNTDRGIYIIGGELKPGIRTPEIYRMKLK